MAFFALLVNQVTRLVDVLDQHREVNERKNAVVTYMQDQQLGKEFRARVIAFMNFHATSARRRYEGRAFILPHSALVCMENQYRDCTLRCGITGDPRTGEPRQLPRRGPALRDALTGDARRAPPGGLPAGGFLARAVQCSLEQFAI